ncbi:MAG: hypothetical protein JKY34_01450 [Kordiimonadaceae bacterium]|nr:hypothetical protein [Kordiimonadaceae bacterium]
MAEKPKNVGDNVLSFKAPEPRFPKAAVDYIDSLLTIQRDRFEQELNTVRTGTADIVPTQPVSTHILAESDDFIGTGWSSIGSRRDGTAFRWMGRIGSMLLPIDLSEPRSFSIRGCGFTKRRFLKETTLWLDDQQLEFGLSRRGFNRWTYSGTLPAMAPRPYYILRFQSPGTGRLAVGVDAFVSLAVSEIKVNC